MMASQYSLLWSAHRKNVCDGLSALQQNGEFVDMTLAADGHHVKVHQVIIALASPYIKELMSSAQCSHPVIFLNKVSYKTLSAILEYVYTGEVAVSMDDFNEFLVACRELHIKGLEDMKVQDAHSVQKKEKVEYYDLEKPADEVCYFEVTNKTDFAEDNTIELQVRKHEEILSTNLEETYDSPTDEPMAEEPADNNIETKYTMVQDKSSDTLCSIQYTVSNQGSLQMILNRYIYYLKHSNRNNTRQWRCVDYLNNVKCPALVFTKDDMVIQRISAHIHPFHDKRILKKVKNGAIFTALKEAEENGKSKRGEISSD